MGKHGIRKGFMEYISIVNKGQSLVKNRIRAFEIEGFTQKQKSKMTM